MRDYFKSVGLINLDRHHLSSHCHVARALKFSNLFPNYYLMFTLFRDVLSCERHPSAHGSRAMAVMRVSWYCQKRQRYPKSCILMRACRDGAFSTILRDMGDY